MSKKAIRHIELEMQAQDDLLKLELRRNDQIQQPEKESAYLIPKNRKKSISGREF